MTPAIRALAEGEGLNYEELLAEFEELLRCRENEGASGRPGSRKQKQGCSTPSSIGRRCTSPGETGESWVTVLEQLQQESQKYLPCVLHLSGGLSGDESAIRAAAERDVVDYDQLKRDFLRQKRRFR